MRKYLTLLFTFVFILSLTACTSTNNTDSKDSGDDVVAADALALLTNIWEHYAGDEKFAATGGDSSEQNQVSDAPGKFEISDAQELDRMLGFPAADAEKLEDAASLMHMMNVNTFTCGAFHLKNADDVQTVAANIQENVMKRQWMCGFPEKLAVVSVGDYVISFFGNEELVNTFRDSITGTYEQAKIISEDAIE